MALEPGEPLKLRIKTAPDSFIGLMVIDQSVMLLKSGNDITKDMVFPLLMSYHRLYFAMS